MNSKINKKKIFILYNIDKDLGSIHTLDGTIDGAAITIAT